MPKILAAALAAILFGALSVNAEEMKLRPVAVVELFTSQGCSSCPPADQVLAEIGQRADVIALGYHVDYWDYIGWTDTFGSERHSDLQRAYARNFGASHVYTPQMVINGEVDVVGSHREEVLAAIARAQMQVPVGLVRDGQYLDIEIPPTVAAGDAVVWLVSCISRAEVDVRRGENGGRRLTYTDIVTSRQVLGMYDADAGARIRVPIMDVLPGDADAVVVLVQRENGRLPGKVLGAASLTL